MNGKLMKRSVSGSYTVNPPNVRLTCVDRVQVIRRHQLLTYTLDEQHTLYHHSKMEGRTDREVLTDRRLVPRNPYELEATKAIVLKHIEAGDIEQKDIDLMNSSYRTVTISSFVRPRRPTR